MSQTASEQHRPIDEIMGELNDTSEVDEPVKFARLYAEYQEARKNAQVTQ